MKRLPLFLFIAAFSLLARAEKLTFMPVWTPQAQFAGYYVAQELGFYTDEGLDVTINHVGINSTQLPLEALLDGNAQIISQQLMQAVISRSNGAPLINILQTSQNSALMCVAHTQISKPEDLNGMKIATWTSGHSETFDLMVKEKQLDVEMIPSLQCSNLYFFDAVDATLCYSYNEFYELLFAKGPRIADMNIDLGTCGYNYPEDGLYVTEEWLKDHADEAARFVKASIRGWQYCREHTDEALDVVMKYVRENNVVTSVMHQKLMLLQMLNLLVNPVSDEADFQPITRECFVEMEGKMRKYGFFETPVSYDELIHPLNVVEP